MKKRISLKKEFEALTGIIPNPKGLSGSEFLKELRKEDNAHKSGSGRQERKARSSAVGSVDFKHNRLSEKDCINAIDLKGMSLTEFSLLLKRLQKQKWFMKEMRAWRKEIKH